MTSRSIFSPKMQKQWPSKHLVNYTSLMIFNGNISNTARGQVGSLTDFIMKSFKDYASQLCTIQMPFLFPNILYSSNANASNQQEVVVHIMIKIRPQATDSIRNFHPTIYSMCFHSDKFAPLQDNPPHVLMAAYPHFSQLLHSRTWNVNPRYKFRLTRHTRSHSDNSATCLNSRQPTTTSAQFIRCMHERPLAQQVSLQNLPKLLQISIAQLA